MRGFILPESEPTELGADDEGDEESSFEDEDA